MSEELTARTLAAEQRLAVLEAQLAASELRAADALAQNRQLTALVKGLQTQLERALADLSRTRAELERLKKKKKQKKGAQQKTSQSESDEEPEEEEIDNQPPKTEPRSQNKSDTQKRKPKRKKSLPPHLRRVVDPIKLEHCERCGGTDLAQVGNGEVVERYHYIPAEVVVQRTERETCRCRRCGQLQTASLPPTPVVGGIMTGALLAHIVYSKICLHLPLERVSEDLRAMGLSLADSTINDAMGHVACLVEPLCDGIIEELYGSGLLHLDGTGVKVLIPKEKGSYRGQFTVVSNEDATAYFFSVSKDGEHIANFLRVGTERSYRGYLVADAASNMNLLYKDGLIIECGCWYHARDNFEEAAKSAPIEGTEALAWITALFSVEHESDAAKETAEQRKARRQRASVPVLRGLYRWIARIKRQFDPSEDIYKAAQYCINHKEPLQRFLEDGRIPLTNNQAERDLGPIGRGRKAWLFTGSAAGGERLAKLYTVVGTALRLGLDVRTYLTDVLPKLSTMPANRGRGHLKTLLPRAWKAARAPPASAGTARTDEHPPSAS